MTQPRKVPVASFSPPLLGLPDATRRAAKTQMQLYHLRARMKDEKHPDTETAYRAEVVRPKDQMWKIIVRPRDASIEAFISEAAEPEARSIAPADIEDILKDIPQSGE